jgi:hypothetical protein
MNSFWPRIVVLLLLSGFLLAKQWQRRKLARLEDAARRAYTGKGFDASQVTHRFGELRGQSTGITPRRQRPTGAQSGFAASVRNSLRRLAFFAQRGTPQEAEIPANQPKS